MKLNYMLNEKTKLEFDLDDKEIKILMNKWMIQTFGERRAESKHECPSCKAWEYFDYLFSLTKDREELVHNEVTKLVSMSPEEASKKMSKELFGDPEELSNIEKKLDYKMNYLCPNCGAKKKYADKYDCRYCPICLIWLEHQCDGEDCDFCRKRPTVKEYLLEGDD